MRIVILASVCARTRQRAIAELLAVPGRTVVRYDRRGMELTRYVQGRGVAAVAGWLQVLPMDGPLVNADLRDVVGRDLAVVLDLLSSASVDELILALPEGMDAAVAVAGLDAAGRGDALHSIGVAVDPGTAEDILWRPGSLSEHELAVCPVDLRTTGDFLITNLLWADTVALVSTVCSSASLPASVRGGIGRPVGLLTHVAPRARIMHLACASFAWAGYDEVEVTARTQPGSLVLPTEVESVDGVRTVLCTAARALHPERLFARLPVLTAGAVFSRGTVWTAAVPDRRLTWWGVGPEAGFDDGGAWLHPTRTPGPEVPTQRALQWRPGRGDRATALAFTGLDLDPAEHEALLAECALTEQEQAALGRGELSVDDPFGVSALAAPEQGLRDQQEGTSLHGAPGLRPSRRFRDWSARLGEGT